VDDCVVRVARCEQHLQTRQQRDGLCRHVGAFDGARHHDVGKQQVDVHAASQHGQRLLRIVGLQHVVAEFGKRVDRGRLHLLVVLDDEDRLRSSPHGRARARRRLDGRLRRAGQIDLDGRAVADLAVDLDMAVALLHEAVSHAQPEARALAFGLRGEERIECALDDILRHACSCVSNGQHHVLPGGDIGHGRDVFVVEHRVRQLHRQPAAVGHRVSRIDREIEDHVLELMDVDQRVPQSARDDRLDTYRFTERAPKQIVHAAKRRRQIDDHGLQRLLAAEREQLRRELRAAVDRVDGLADPLARPRIAVMPAVEQFEIAAQYLQQVVEVVSDAARQLAHGFHLLGAKQCRAGLFELPAGVQAFGDVPRDLRETDERAVFAPDRVDHDVCPETLAILAHAPSLGLEASFACGNRQPAFRQSGCRVFWRIEAGEVRADHFFGAEALDSPRAGVPVRDRAVGREHEDRVVRDAVDEHPEALLAFDDGFVSNSLVRHVAHDFGKTGNATLFVFQSRDHDAGPEARAIAPDAPAFRLGTPRAPRRFEGGRGGALSARFRCMEHVEMPADDFLTREAVNLLAADVPRPDRAVA